MADLAGLEPASFCLEDRRSNSAELQAPGETLGTGGHGETEQATFDITSFQNRRVAVSPYLRVSATPCLALVGA